MNRTSILFVTALLAACQGREAASPPAHVEQVVDSVIPREEALRRFREGVPEVQRLSGGAASREALAREVLRAVAARDTAALTALTVSKAEFAWLYYPTASQGLPPYDLAPALYWFTLDSRNHRALSVLLEGNTADLKYAGHDCGATATVEGANQLWGPCTIRSTAPGGKPIADRYMSLVIEREGVWKVVQYSDGKNGAAQ